MKQKPNIPLSVPNLSLDILDNVKECIETGWVSTGGRFITEFEKKVAEYTGVDDAVGVQSGTAALHLAFQILGVEVGDEVIVPTVTFIATVNPITYLGAKPIFMDCDDSLNMDLDKLESFLEDECSLTENGLINEKTNNKIKALTVVNVFGNPIDMERVIEIAQKYNLKVVEDAAESLGSFYKGGKYKDRHTGTIGDIGVLSFNANKILTTGGGGMILSNDKDILERARFLSVQAKTNPLYFEHDEIGYNYRLTNIAAAFGTKQIDKIEDFVEIKKRNYELYKKELDKIEGLDVLPFNENTRPNYWFYSVIVDKNKYGLNRDELLMKLNDIGIQARPLWGLISDQKPYKDFEAYKIDKARHYVDNLINIPCSTNLTKEKVYQVIEMLKKFKIQK
ncbi:aminotransferase, LLPSF_NHT_00031 family [Halanaerobium congolense]|jgi:aminotransferase in exopolysaccharide biosynthesis|uniref:Aminotransferase, LLPSF_NHT_00031 family n=1 Tax=Halanaerobium congolense TaxID=54121 RepID=A0A1H9ZQ90_9FIRM|nr:LegC family aminotransferase [Halanaerobium congolense]PTX16335.1 aminotransferase in exopolysaccharide biosynthesis [Halanaerobium congolense]SDF15083.1 aminotransferase, LLPSF_NHT_00031 family [Halanaerobium congolense]SES83874.1 aminotransferase, LLPSF_NHT_00031 family [Halanaerobium congolense]SFP44640.1 aminotransferase, LLPSF_NHT_00031 family [Halanaerobium congolense]